MSIPIDALFDSSGTRPNPELVPPPGEVIDGAELIFGLDRMTGEEFLVFGREILQAIVDEDLERPAKVLKVELDWETDDLERLLALVQVIKGSHDYRTA